MSGPTIPAVYFDGRRSAPHQVTLTIAGGRLIVDGEDVYRLAPLAAIDAGDAIGGAPRFVRFRDGGFCEVADDAALRAALAAEGHAPRRVDQWERSPRTALTALALVGVLLAAAYIFVLPVVVRMVAARVPQRTLEAIGTQVLASLDDGVLEPSALPPERRAEIGGAFKRLPLPPDVAEPSCSCSDGARRSARTRWPCRPAS